MPNGRCRALVVALACAVASTQGVAAGQARTDAGRWGGAAIELQDDRGSVVALAMPPQRIVSLLPSLTESVCVLGACSRLVGVDRFSNWPASVLALPKLGGIDDAQIERIVALRPDVVLASTSGRASARLEALGVKVLALESRTHADVHRSLAILAKVLGIAGEGDRVWAGVERRMQAAADRVPPAWRRQRVYFEVDAAPYAAGAESFIGQTLLRLGLANAVPAGLGAFPKLNPEFVVRMQPDIVMAAQRALREMPRRPGWGAVRAIDSQRTCGFSEAHYELLVRPGPRLGEAADVLADCLVALAARGPSPALR